MSDVKKGQESLKGQLEQMIQQMKDGSKPGKEGQMKLAQMLAQQEIYQQMLNQIMNNGSVGSNAQKQLKEIQHLMEQNKRDIVNRITSYNVCYTKLLRIFIRSWLMKITVQFERDIEPVSFLRACDIKRA